MKNLFITILMFGLTWSQGMYAQVGCTNPEASNYDATAVLDDGSCCFDTYLTISCDQDGLLQVFQSLNYNLYADLTFPGEYELCIPDGCYLFVLYDYSTGGFSMDYSINGESQQPLTVNQMGYSETPFTFGQVIQGCNDPAACNYEPNANCPGFCTYECLGCTDQNAPNYDPEATISDGSCCSAETWYTIELNVPAVVDYYDLSGINGGFSFAYPESNGLCLPGNCIQMLISALEPTDIIEFNLYNSNNELVYSDVYDYVPFDYQLISINGGLSGCIDPNACNFNPNATCQDYNSCDYSCYGCTDVNAPNYDPNATVDNGTCCSIEDWVTFTTDQPANMYVYSASVFGGTYISYSFAEPGSYSFCLPAGCYALNATFVNGSTANYSLVKGNGTVLLEGQSVYNGFINQITINFENDAVIGCQDSYACNYNPNVTCPDYSLCIYDCFGCTDPTALNYNESASVDNGTCCYQQFSVSLGGSGGWTIYSTYSYYMGSEFDTNPICAEDGCYDIFVFGEANTAVTVTNHLGEVLVSGVIDEYNEFVGSFSFDAIEGCVDSYACNYNPEANCNDGSCDYSCYGCTDETASNYSSIATIDNGTCCYGDFYTVSSSEPVYWSMYQLSGYGASGEQNGGFCSDGTCFYFYITNLVGTPVDFTVFNPDGTVFYSGNTGEEGYFYDLFEFGEISGCVDPDACNFNPDATCGDWNACDYSCYGCTNSEAFNYDPAATIDDGTCCTDGWYTIALNEPGYWYIFNPTTGVGFGGNYPEQSGFCMDGTCFQLYAFGYYGAVEFTITDQNGTVVETGASDEYGYYYDSVSIGDEVAGCIYTSACNYNPDATCDDGSCIYYCGGCTDPDAFNYNPYAQFEDGSCFYSAEIPQLQLYTEEDEQLSQYYIFVEMMTLGNGAPYLLSTDYAPGMQMADESGQYILGPFPCDQDVVVNVNSAEYGLMEYYTSDPILGPCNIIQSTDELENITLEAYPNPTQQMITIEGIPSEVNQLMIMDMTGRIVMEVNTNGTNRKDIDLSTLSQGIYQVKCVGSTMSISIVKN